MIIYYYLAEMKKIKKYTKIKYNDIYMRIY